MTGGRRDDRGMADMAGSGICDFAWIETILQIPNVVIPSAVRNLKSWRASALSTMQPFVDFRFLSAFRNDINGSKSILTILFIHVSLPYVVRLAAGEIKPNPLMR